MTQVKAVGVRVDGYKNLYIKDKIESKGGVTGSWKHLNYLLLSQLNILKINSKLFKMTGSYFQKTTFS